MSEITISLMPEVSDWLNKRALQEKCTVEDFAILVLNAVCINSQLNQNRYEKEEIIQEA